MFFHVLLRRHGSWAKHFSIASFLGSFCKWMWLEKWRSTAAFSLSDHRRFAGSSGFFLHFFLVSSLSCWSSSWQRFPPGIWKEILYGINRTKQQKQGKMAVSYLPVNKINFKAYHSFHTNHKPWKSQLIISIQHLLVNKQCAPLTDHLAHSLIPLTLQEYNFTPLSLAGKELKATIQLHPITVASCWKFSSHTSCNFAVHWARKVFSECSNNEAELPWNRLRNPGSHLHLKFRLKRKTKRNRHKGHTDYRPHHKAITSLFTNILFQFKCLNEINEFMQFKHTVGFHSMGTIIAT